MSTVVAANVAASKPVVTLKDIAAKAGCSISAVSVVINGGKSRQKVSSATSEKILKAAKQLGYQKSSAYRNCGDNKRNAPANPIFASREAETAAMRRLYQSGHSSAETAHRCGVNVKTVRRRIGAQPAEITAANKKLAGKVRSAKAKIKKAYVQQQTVAEYNELAAKLNAQLEEAKKMATELSAMQKKAKVASKATNVPLLRVLQGGVAS